MFKSIQLIDGLCMYQDHEGVEMPTLGEFRHCVYDAQTGDVTRDYEPAFTYEGSHSTSIKISISGSRVRISRGNPSKINRLDNLFGYQTIDSAVSAYNQILLSLGLPPFTKCSKVWHLQGEEGDKVQKCSNGAIITEIHTTTNKAVGFGNEYDYLKGLSTQRLRNSIPNLKPNGCTLEWLTKLNLEKARGGSLIYSSVYNKANEIALHQLPKIKRLYGEHSSEYQYLQQVHQYCLEQGVMRFEHKFKSSFLRRHDLQFWGLSDYSRLDQEQENFVNLDKKLKADAMTFISMAELLKEEGVCSSTQAANATAGYYYMWLHGQHFDLSKSQVKTHRARLRKIGVDIAEMCDVTKHTAVRIRQSKEIEVKPLAVPSWYQMPNTRPNLKLVA